LNKAVASIKEFQSGGSVIIPGPVWLFQLWLLATFKMKLGISLPGRLSKAHKERFIEGIGLAMLQYGNKSSLELFSIAYNVFLSCDVFTPSMAPFTTRTRGPTWFTKTFPATSIEDEAETNDIWEAYLNPTFLSSKVTSGSPYGIYGYQPNHVA